MGKILRRGFRLALISTVASALFLCMPARASSHETSRQKIQAAVDDASTWRTGTSLMIAGSACFSLSMLLSASAIAMTVTQVVIDYRGDPVPGGDFPILLNLSDAFVLTSIPVDISAGALFMAGTYYQREAVDDSYTEPGESLVKAGKALFGLAVVCYSLSGILAFGTWIPSIVLLWLGKGLMIASAGCFLHFSAALRKRLIHGTSAGFAPRLEW